LPGRLPARVFVHEAFVAAVASAFSV